MLTILKEAKQITQIALPLMAAFLAQKGMQVIDTVMMGRIGSHALAAGALGSAVFMTVLVFCMGILSAIGVYIANALGSKSIADIRHFLQQGLYLAMIVAVPCMLLLWIAPQILISVGEDPSIVAGTQLFLHALVWGFPGLLCFLVFREFLSAFSLTRVVMFISLAAMPLTFSANYILIYGKWGFPKLGIAGIGYATALIQWLMFFSLFLYAKTHVKLKEHVAFVVMPLDGKKIRDMLLLGSPSGVMLVMDVSMCLMAAVMMGYFGVEALSAHQIALQCASIAFACPLALSMAVALRVGQAVGAHDVVQINRTAYTGLGLGLFVMILASCLFFFAPGFLTKQFVHPSENNYLIVERLATSLLSIAAIFQCFDALQMIANGALRGMKDTFVPMLLCILSYWLIGVPSAYYLAFYAKKGPVGIWYGLTIGICLAAVMLALRYLKREGLYLIGGSRAGASQVINSTSG